MVTSQIRQAAVGMLRRIPRMRTPIPRSRSPKSREASGNSASQFGSSSTKTALCWPSTADGLPRSVCKLPTKRLKGVHMRINTRGQSGLIAGKVRGAASARQVLLHALLRAQGQ